MADAETMTRRVQVANLPPADSGRGVARLPVKLMNELGLAEGDVIEIVGKRSTAARAIRPYGDDEGLDIIRLDGLQRANAGVGSGDFVEVRKADVQARDAGRLRPGAEQCPPAGLGRGAASAASRAARSPRATRSPPPATSGSMPTCPSISGNCSTPRPSRSRKCG